MSHFRKQLLGFRYALICKQCQSHNGMALREEFEYVAYRCAYCFYWNPARKQGRIKFNRFDKLNMKKCDFCGRIHIYIMFQINFKS